MKHIKQISTVFIGALFMAVAIFYSCSKHEITDQPVTGNGEVTMSEDDYTVMNKIIAFRDKVMFIRKNPEVKNGELIDADQAIWDMETLFNTTYAFPDEQYRNTKTNNIVMQLDINENDELLLSDVVAKYDEILNFVTQFYYNSGFNQKGFLLLDIEKGEVVNGKLEINIRSVTGEKSEGWEPFGPDDDWLYGHCMGRCDYTQDTTDAAEEIQKALNSNKPIVSPPPGYRFVYVLDDLVVLDYEEIINYPNPDPPAPANYMDYLIFYCTEALGQFTPGVEDCLLPEEMNFQFEGEKTVIYQKLPIELNKPSNWVFRECNLKGLDVEDNNGKTIYYHQNNLTYAYRYLAAIAVIEEAKEFAQ